MDEKSFIVNMGKYTLNEDYLYGSRNGSALN